MIVRGYKDAIATIKALYKQVYEETSKLTAPREATVRQALANDFGVASPVWDFTGLTSGAWNDIITYTVPDNTVIGVYGINLLDDTQKVTAVRVTVGGAVRRLWDVTDVYNADDNGRTLFLDSADQLVVSENSDVTVSIYATDTEAKIQLLAFLGEERGRTIDKPAL